jgi:hypothetical protein
VFELFGPVIELIGYAAFIVALMLGYASPAYTVAFLALAVFLGSAISISAVALEEVSFRRYRRFQDLLALLGVALVENFGYRQMSTWWRLHGLVSATRRDLRWGAMERKGLERSPGQIADRDEESVGTLGQGDPTRPPQSKHDSGTTEQAAGWIHVRFEAGTDVNSLP